MLCKTKKDDIIEFMEELAIPRRDNKKKIVGIIVALIVTLGLIGGGMIGWTIWQRAPYASALAVNNEMTGVFDYFYEEFDEGLEAMDEVDLTIEFVESELAELRRVRGVVERGIENLGREKVFEKDSEASALYDVVMSNQADFLYTVDTFDEMYDKVSRYLVRLGITSDDTEISMEELGPIFKDLREGLSELDDLQFELNRDYVEALRVYVVGVDDALTMVKLCSEGSKSCDQNQLAEFDMDALQGDFMAAIKQMVGRGYELLDPVYDLEESLFDLGSYLEKKANGKK